MSKLFVFYLKNLFPHEEHLLFLLDAAGCVLCARPLVLIILTFSFFLSVEHNVKGWEADHSVCAHRQTLAPPCDKPVRSDRCSRHQVIIGILHSLQSDSSSSF